MELTERMIAIAEGNDPDKVAADTGIVTEDDSARQQDTGTSVTSGDAPSPIAPANEGDETATDGQPNTGSMDAAGKPQSANAGKPNWINDQVRQFAQAYGMGDDDLADFGDEKAFRRATALMDRQFAAFGKNGGDDKAGVASVKDGAAGGAGQGTGRQSQQKEEDISLDVQKYIDAGYDDETINLVKFAKSLQDKVSGFDSFVQQFQAQQAAVAQQEYVNRFHDAVDSLNPAYFGRSLDEKGNVAQLSKEQMERRNKLHEAKELIEGAMRTQAERAGQQYQPLPLPSLLQRAAQFAFGDELQKAVQEKRQQQIQQQSSKRRSVASSNRNTSTGRYMSPEKKSSGGSMYDTREYVAQIMADPEVAKMLRGLQTT